MKLCNFNYVFRLHKTIEAHEIGCDVYNQYPFVRDGIGQSMEKAIEELT
jgi:hypothetical protein